MKRDYGFDNIKCILILCVVFGHLIEPFDGFSLLYRMIYLFHMPAFMFVTGYFSKFGVRSLVQKIWLYVLFQFLYICMESRLGDPSVTFGVTTPYWLLWYMFVLIFYTALIPLYRAKTNRKRVIVLVITVVLALGAGFFKNIEYPYSLSRFFVFQPYFVMGYYAKEKNVSAVGKRTFLGFSACAVLTLGLAWFNPITKYHLYGSVGYAEPSEVVFRLLVFLVACVWIVVFMGIKDRVKRKIPVISMIGQNTLSIYLLHGFLMKLGYMGYVSMPRNIVIVLLTAAAICLVFGNMVTGKLMALLSPTSWMKKGKVLSNGETLTKNM